MNPYTPIFLTFLLVLTSYCNGEPAAWPPVLTHSPEAEIAFRSDEDIRIKCVASGDPTPSYYWKKDGSILDVNGLDIKQMPEEGTLVIQNPQLHHSGVYQCFAKNEFGTALSIKTILRKAELESFPTLHRGPEIHRPQVGKPLVLRCSPPRSYPAATVYWGENKNQSKLMPIINDARVSLDFKGKQIIVNYRVFMTNE